MLAVPPAPIVSKLFKSPPDQSSMLPLAVVSALFTVPPDQVNTALVARFSVPIIVPPDQFIVPWKMLAPVQLANTVPFGTSTVPVVLKSHWRVVAPAPAVFWKVPVLTKVLVMLL